MPNISEELDWQIYFKQEGAEEATPFYWVGTDGMIDRDRPVTFRTAYETLKNIFEPIKEADKELNNTKSEFKQGHRKKMFSDAEVEKIKDLHTKGMSKNKIAKMYGCSEKTIRNYLKS